MGVFFSCLKPIQTQNEEEDISSLSDDRAKLIEDELSTELRNKQLNAILNSTNDHLIDITTFKTMVDYGSTTSEHNEQQQQQQINDGEEDDFNDIFKVTPISQEIIQSEIEKELKGWSQNYGEIAVQKYLDIPEPKNKEKLIIDFV